jgi:uncharacterized RDD family membrane protein YckC
MVSFGGSLLTGVDASAAQNLPVTKTCSQCGAVLPSGVRVCDFCDSSFSVGFSAAEESSVIPTHVAPARNVAGGVPGSDTSVLQSAAVYQAIRDGAWRGELTQRLKAFRTRRSKLSAYEGQSHFSFDDSADERQAGASIALEEPLPSPENDFSFTIAIGRSAKNPAVDEAPMEIDVSVRPDTEVQPHKQPAQAEAKSHSGIFPVASIDDRRLAAIIDLFCLLFAYGGFLGLFGSLGGHFTLSKLSVAVCATTFAIVYLQYFALFTVFGGTTPGMMMRGLQVVSFSGESPTPKQMLLRSAGYLLSAGTFFLGFLWAMWDEDELTWHDRLSRTYLSAEQTLADLEASGAAQSR